MDICQCQSHLMDVKGMRLPFVLGWLLHVWGGVAEVYGKSLYLPLNLLWILNRFPKKNLNKKVETYWEIWHIQKTPNSHCILSFKLILVRMARLFFHVGGNELSCTFNFIAVLLLKDNGRNKYTIKYLQDYILRDSVNVL